MIIKFEFGWVLVTNINSILKIYWNIDFEVKFSV